MAITGVSMTGQSGTIYGAVKDSMVSVTYISSKKELPEFGMRISQEEFAKGAESKFVANFIKKIEAFGFNKKNVETMMRNLGKLLA